MSSQKEWGDNPDLATEPLRRPLRVVMLRIAMVIGFIAAAIAIGRGVWRLVSPDAEFRLAEIRRILEPIANQETRPETSRVLLAVEHAEQYLKAGGEHETTARLFLSAALNLLQVSGMERPANEPARIERLLNEINARDCSASDLVIAIDLFVYVGQLGRADWLIGWVLEKHGDDPDVLRTAIKIRYDLGREDDVLELCRKLTVLAPQDPFPRRVIMMVHQDSGYAEKVVDAIDDLLPLLTPPAAEERITLIENLIAVGNLARARREFSALRDAAPEALSNRPMIEANLLMIEGKASEALPIADRVLSNDPRAIDALLLRGRILFAKNRIDEACDTLVQLVEIDPMNNDGHYVLGQALARRGDSEAAQFHLDQHRKLLDTRVLIHRLERRAGNDPTDVEARLELARLYEELSLSEQAAFWRQAAYAVRR